jgi:hypothetical protein
MVSKTTIETYNTLCERLDNSKKVCYSRFGDGDIFIMSGSGDSYHKWSPELQKELIDSIKIKNENYLVGIAVNYPKEDGMYQGVFEPFNYNSKLENILIEKINFNKNDIFESAVVFHYLSVFKPNMVTYFLNKYIRPKKKMFVGSIEKKDIERLIGNVDYYVKIPDKNAYYSMDKWYSDVLENIDNCEVLIPAAGMATRVLNKRLWELNKNIHSIDLGSVVDAAANLNTRTWIKKEGDKIKNILIK